MWANRKTEKALTLGRLAPNAPKHARNIDRCKFPSLGLSLALVFTPSLTAIDGKLTRLQLREEQEIFHVGVELGAPFPGDKTSRSAEQDEDAEGDEPFRALVEVLRSRGKDFAGQ